MQPQRGLTRPSSRVPSAVNAKQASGSPASGEAESATPATSSRWSSTPTSAAPVDEVEADQVRYDGPVGLGLLGGELHAGQHLGVVRVVAVGAAQVGAGRLLAVEEGGGVHAVAAVEVRDALHALVLAQHEHDGDGHGGQGHRDRRQHGLAQEVSCPACW